MDIFHADHIYNAFKLILCPVRDLNSGHVGSDTVLNLLQNTEKIRSHTVNFIYKENPRHMVPVRLPPDGFGLRLDPARGAKHNDRPVQDLQRPLDFHGKIHVSRGIDNINFLPLPETGRVS